LGAQLLLVMEEEITHLPKLGRALGHLLLADVGKLELRATQAFGGMAY